MRNFVLFSLLLISSVLMAQDRQLAFTYQSQTLGKGQVDLEVWNTLRFGRELFYQRLDQRFELETGLTDKLQVAFYFNSSHKVGALGDTLDGVAKSSSFSFSNEWKWKLTDPSKPLGFSLYGEYTVSAEELELEGKLILDHRTEKHILALNQVFELELEYEIERGELELEQELKLETDLAYMYTFKPTFGLGLESRYLSVSEHGEFEHAAIFAGPTLYFQKERFFMITSFLPQLASFIEDTDDTGLDLKEYEKYHARILVGFTF
jgi:hypothetical protein